VFAKHIVANGATVSLASNRMRVAECEIVFQFGQSIEPRQTGWSLQDILQTLASVHPGIEVPDSRFLKFETAGEASLIADCACSNDMVLGKGLKPDNRLQGLRDLQVKAQMRDGRHFEGVGTNVLGDPLEALRWFVNEITQSGQTIQEGQFVTTGACVVPIPVLPGQTIEADFGWMGRMCVHFS
jgi:2-keto-4-pentenoate hydratase